MMPPCEENEMSLAEKLKREISFVSYELITHLSRNMLTEETMRVIHTIANAAYAGIDGDVKEVRREMRALHKHGEFLRSVKNKRKHTIINE